MTYWLICSIRFAEVGQTASLQQCVDWFWKRALLSECRFKVGSDTKRGTGLQGTVLNCIPFDFQGRLYFRAGHYHAGTVTK